MINPVKSFLTHGPFITGLRVSHTTFFKKLILSSNIVCQY